MHPIPHTGLDALSFSSASGGLSVAYGMLPARRAQVPHDWPSPILRFMSPATSPPKPSARRAAPRQSPPQIAA